MKKVMVFMMLLLSTSLAMAQFGDLEEIIKKAESEKSGEQMPDKPNTPDKPNNYSPSMSLSLLYMMSLSSMRAPPNEIAKERL